MGMAVHYLYKVFEQGQVRGEHPGSESCHPDFLPLAPSASFFLVLLSLLFFPLLFFPCISLSLLPSAPLLTHAPVLGTCPEAFCVPSSVWADTGDTDESDPSPLGSPCPVWGRGVWQGRLTQSQIIIKGMVCAVVEVAQGFVHPQRKHLTQFGNPGRLLGRSVS